ncbi:bacteriophage T4 gp5 trimerisation domain-containing protein [Nannocystis bainbridge]|uniref:bacteriophage T4 gp5 trimerisation domain-containing protein n=1 Tax=Nannocystis bainbridge TaxID=2995303 RepID=UPI00358DC786
MCQVYPGRRALSRASPDRKAKGSASRRGPSLRSSALSGLLGRSQELARHGERARSPLFRRKRRRIEGDQRFILWRQRARVGQAEVGHRRQVEVGHRQRAQVGHRRRVEVGHRQRAQVGHRRRAQVGHRQRAQVGHRRRAQVGHRQRAQIGHRRRAQVGRRVHVGLEELAQPGVRVRLSLVRWKRRRIEGEQRFILRRQRTNKLAERGRISGQLA